MRWLRSSALACLLVPGPAWAADDGKAENAVRYEAMSEKQLSREIKMLEKKMLAHARNLEFEEAARVRDQLSELKKRVFGVALASE